MRKLIQQPIGIALLLFSAAICLGASPLAAQFPDDLPRTRTIYVPLEDLQVLLEGQTERVFMTREEYQQLKKEAEQQPRQRATQSHAMKSSQFSGRIDKSTLWLQGSITIEVLQSGLQEIILPIQHARILKADLNNQGAALVRDEAGQIRLLIDEPGTHQLELSMVVPVALAAAEQSFQMQLPFAAAAQFELEVAGNVEIKKGAEVIAREYDESSDLTRFEIVPTREIFDVVMSLNNKALRDERLVTARSVVVAEITSTYQRLHGTFSFDVLHGAVEQVAIEIPAGFQVTQVETELLDRWQVVADEDEASGGARRLLIQLREPTRSTFVLRLSAIETPVDLADWQMPRLRALDVSGEVGIVGVVAETRLEPQRFVAEGLIPLPTDVLLAALPDSVLESEPGAPDIQPVSAYYSYGAESSLQGNWVEPEDALEVAMHLLLEARKRELSLSGGFLLAPQTDKVSAFEFTIPADWYLTGLSSTIYGQLPVKRFEEGDVTRIYVRLPQAVAPGETFNLVFNAVSVPTNWLGDWTNQAVPFPQVKPLDANASTGAIALRSVNEFQVRVTSSTGVAPLDASERTDYGLADSLEDLAFRVSEADYAMQLEFRKSEARISSRNYSFFQVAPGVLHCRYEVLVNVEQAPIDELELILPAGTPRTVSFVGDDGTIIKESELVSSETEQRWRVRFAQSVIGQARVLAEFEQSIQTELADRSLPLIRVADVLLQSEMVAVEGHSELTVDVETSMRPVDVGELSEAKYLPGRRLLGSFDAMDGQASIEVDVAPRALRALPAAIVERAEMVTMVAASGRNQTSARYLVRTKVPFLEIQLPEMSELWAVMLDGKPIKPQRRGDAILLTLQNDQASEARDLQVVYEVPSQSFGLLGRIAAIPPRLLLKEEFADDGREVPQADLVWHLHLPRGYKVSRVHGNVFPQEEDETQSAMQRLAQASDTLGKAIEESAPVMSPGRIMARNSSVDTAAEFEYGASAGSEAPADGAEATMEFDDEAELPLPPGMAGDGEGTPWQSLRDVDRASIPMSEEEAESPQQPSVNDSLGIQANGGLAPAGPGREAAQQSGQGQQASGMPSSGDAFGLPENFADIDLGDVQQQSFVGKYWAMQGLGSLKIDLAVEDASLTLTSVGADPRLDTTIVNQDRMAGLAWGVGLAILVGGLIIERTGLSVQVTYTIVVLLAALGLPLLNGPWQDLEDVWQKMLYAGLLLPALFLALNLLRTSWRLVVAVAKRLGFRSAPSTTANTSSTVSRLIGLAIFLSCLGATTALVEAAAPQSSADSEERPVAVPDDALIVPYDLSDDNGVAAANQVLVPYAEYQRLKQLANADEPTNGSQRRFGLAGASYQATLPMRGASDNATMMVIRGEIQIETFGDTESWLVPLGLSGAVITEAKLDGKPAKLESVVPQQIPVQVDLPNQAAQQQMEVRVPPVMSVRVPSAGRHTLSLEISVPLTQQGGWLSLDVQLPTVVASTLAVVVQEPQTQLRILDSSEPWNYLTEEVNETIKLAAKQDGRYQLTWRPRIDEGSVDRGLTVDSTGILDVREDGLRLHWYSNFAFGRNEKSSFRFTLPDGFILEKVQGNNVRGWETIEADGPTQVEVQLLKSVREAESILLVLSQQVAQQTDRIMRFDAPYVVVPEAALHRGVLAIRRSPVLSVRTLETSQVARTSADALNDSMLQAVAADESPLGQQMFQVFRFNGTPFQVALESTLESSEISVEAHTLWRIGETQGSLESRLRYSIAGRGIEQLQIKLPSDLDLREVELPGKYIWTVSDEEDFQTLRIFLADVRTGALDVRLAGGLAEHTSDATLSFPRINVSDAQSFSGMLVVQADPSLQVTPRSLVGMESVLMERASSWLATGQRTLARLAFSLNVQEYSGELQLSRKAPRVRCDSITNVRATYHAIEETILLDFRIEEAGIRRLRFVVPERMANAKFLAARTREKTIEPIDGEAKVLVTLTLQDALMGDYRVMMTYDRPLSSDQQPVPIPVIETGEVNYQFVTLQNASRDELVISDDGGMEPLDRSQSQWKKLQDALAGGEFTMAYLVIDQSTADAFRWELRRREIVETSGARIGLAETELVIDGGGGYRAIQKFHIDNRTEPYLEVELPESSRLWTAFVAGQPVKPAIVPGGGDRLVRIPLVKTAEGDLDYEVVLKYGGQLGDLRTWSEISFPLITAVNINVELSQVKLWLPESHEFFAYDGNAELVPDESEFAAEQLAYETRQVERLTAALRSKNSFSVTRALSNLKQIQSDSSSQGSSGSGGKKLAESRMSNERALQQAQEEISEIESIDEVIVDNRDRLNSFYSTQYNDLAQNQVLRLGGNFSAEQFGRPMGEADVTRDFDDRWLNSNGLANSATLPEAANKPDGKSEARPEREFSSRLQTNRYDQAGAARAKGDFDAGQQFYGNNQIDAAEREEDRFGSKLSLKEQYEQKLLENQTESRFSRGGYSAPGQAGSGGRPGAGSGLGGGGGFGGGGFGSSSGEASAGQADAGVQSGNGDINMNGRRLDGGEFASDFLDSSNLDSSGAMALGFSSLDVDFPRRGTPILFSTPRGNVELKARVVEAKTVRHATDAIFVIGLLIVTGIGLWLYRQLSARNAGRWVLVAALTLIGMVSVCGSYWPLIGAWLIVAAIVIGLQTILRHIDHSDEGASSSAA